MKYKGFNIEPVYSAGSDFKIMADGRLKDRRPTSKDVVYYQIIDSEGEDWIAEGSIKECKKTIDSFLEKVNNIL